MARWQFPAWTDLAWATVRGLGWLTALGAVLIMSFIMHRWPDTECGIKATALSGAAAALLTDSWQAIALGGHIGFPPLTRSSTMLADSIALAFSSSGLFLILFKKILFAQAPGRAMAVVAVDLRLNRRRQFAPGDLFRAAVCALAMIRCVGLLLFSFFVFTHLVLPTDICTPSAA